MWTLGLRAIVPFALLIAGIVSVIHGAKHHVIPVVQEHEEEVSIPIPMPFMPSPDAFPGGIPGPGDEPLPQSPSMPPLPPADGEPPGEKSPFDQDQPPTDGPPLMWQPPQMFHKLIKKVVETTDEPEPRIIRLVSVGGLTLTDEGEIKRTRSDEDGPALCPT